MSSANILVNALRTVNSKMKYTTFKGSTLQNTTFDRSSILFCIFRNTNCCGDVTWEDTDIKDPLVRECTGLTFEGGKAFGKEIERFNVVSVNDYYLGVFVMTDGTLINAYGSTTSKEEIIKKIEAASCL